MAPAGSPPTGALVTLISIVSGALSFVSTIVSLFTDCWQVNSKGSVVLSLRCRGLWSECVWDKFVKIWTCDVFGSYLNPHPAAVVISRASLVLSAIAGAGAFFCLALGCRYFSCFQEATAKRRCLRLAAGFYFLAGLLSCLGVIRYGAYVFSKHQYEVSLRIPGFPSFEYGSSLWVAIAGIPAAFLAAASSCYETKLLESPGANPAEEVARDSPGTVCTYV